MLEDDLARGKVSLKRKTVHIRNWIRVQYPLELTL